MTPVEIVEGVLRSDNLAREALYWMIQKISRARHRHRDEWQDSMDREHDAYLKVSQAIEQGRIRDGRRLAGYVDTTIRNQRASLSRAAMAKRIVDDPDLMARLHDHQPNPEEAQLALERKRTLKLLLYTLSDRHRGLFIRVYLDNQPIAAACRAFGLQEVSFRPLKKRAMSKLREAARRSV